MAAVPLVALLRFAIIASITAYENWDTIEGTLEAFREEPDPPDFGRQLTVRMGKRIASGDNYPEKAQYGIHFVNITSGELDTTWTTGDFTTVEGAFDTFHSSIAARMNAQFRIEEYRWYRFGPRIFAPNPPVRSVIKTTPFVFTGTDTMHQVASTITLRSPLRRHWGRIYLPHAHTNFSGGTGQLSPTDVDAIDAAFETLRSTCATAGIMPVIWDRARKSALNMTAHEVDSVLDVIRRRRPSTTNYRKITPTPT